MSKFLYLLPIAGVLAFGSLNAQDCKTFHKRKCYGSDNSEMVYNTQSKSGMFVLGHTSELVFVAHSGQDYRVSLCQEDKVEEPIKFKIVDSRSQDVLFDNETATLDVPADEGQQGGLPMYFEFTSEVTKKIIVRITAPGPPPEEGGKKSEQPDPKNLFCIGVLIENMPTPKLGF